MSQTQTIPVSEAAFQEAVIELARLHGWLCHAERPARTQDSWRTPIQGDPGWPDLCLVRPPTVLFLELKSQNGKVRPEQVQWIGQINRCQVGVEAHVCRPSDWPLIESLLNMIPGVDPEALKQAVDTAQTLNAMTTLQMSHGPAAVRYPADINQLKMLCAVLLQRYVEILGAIAIVNEESVEELWERLCLAAETKHHHLLTKES